MTILFSFIFTLSLAFATYILIKETQKRKKLNREVEFHPESEHTETGENISTMIDAPPLTDSIFTLPKKPTTSFDTIWLSAKSLLSNFETFLLPEKPVTSIVEPLQPSRKSESSLFKSVALKSSASKSLALKPAPVIPELVQIKAEPYLDLNISDLQVEPSRANLEDTVFISFIITNNTSIIENRSVSLKIGGIEQYFDYIVLNPYESKSLTFPARTILPGEWDIDVNNVLCKLTILENNR